MSENDRMVYVRQLYPKGHGFPHWEPDPDENLPQKYIDKGISVGDVGIITEDGGFDFLFSICFPSDDPINGRGVPDAFEDVPSPPLEISSRDGYHVPGIDIASHSINKVVQGVGFDGQASP